MRRQVLSRAAQANMSYISSWHWVMLAYTNETRMQMQHVVVQTSAAPSMHVVVLWPCYIAAKL